MESFVRATILSQVKISNVDVDRKYHDMLTQLRNFCIRDVKTIENDHWNLEGELGENHLIYSQLCKLQKILMEMYVLEECDKEKEQQWESAFSTQLLIYHMSAKRIASLHEKIKNNYESLKSSFDNISKSFEQFLQYEKEKEERRKRFENDLIHDFDGAFCDVGDQLEAFRMGLKKRVEERAKKSEACAECKKDCDELDFCFHSVSANTEQEILNLKK